MNRNHASTLSLRLAVGALTAGLIFIACASEDPIQAGGASSGTAAPGACGTPNDGCPCDSPGESVECGTVKYQSGDHVSCSMGRRTCVAGRWGTCIGTHLVATSTAAAAAGAIKTSAITQGPCPAPPDPLANPCDPYCNQIIDDGVLTIPGGPSGTCAWYEAADKAAAYAALNNSWRAIRGGATQSDPLVGPCTGGATDRCQNDSFCNGGTQCSFYASGGTNAACAGWDLTFGTPCVDATDTLTICNRGNGPTPAAGTYWGVVSTDSLQGRPSDVSLCVAAPASVRGYCSIDFATTTIAPGTCISRPTSSICPGVNFGNSGVPGTDRTTVQWNMPDWPHPNCGNRARIATECNAANNNTNYDQNKAIACQGIGCGAGPSSGSAELYPVSTTANCSTTCGGATNLGNGGTACVGPGYGTCRQDFRCSTATSTCTWNGGSGYFDPGAGAADLTIGTPCGPGGATPWSIPICNRGSAPVPAGSVTVHFTDPPAVPDTCGPVASPYPACNVPLPAGGLEPGQCFNTTACPSPSPGAKMVTVNWGGAIPEAAGACANNVAGALADGAAGCAACGACNTRISGRVFDPSSGAPAIPNANNLPLSGISVFQPSGALTPLVDGIACDSCASVDSPKVLGRYAVTDAMGAFTLPNMVPGTAARVVVQSGRWRREITVPVTACIDNPIAAGVLRMPRDRTDGAGGFANIPKTAVFFGKNDPYHCLILKLGISASEMQPYTGAANPNRFQIFRHPTNGGMNTVPAAPNDDVAFPILNTYSQVISGCTSGGAGLDLYAGTQLDQLISWGQAGGRMFLTHGPARSVVKDNPTALGALFLGTGVPTWDGGDHAGQTSVVTGTPPNDTFRDWLVNVGASTVFGPGFISIAEGRAPYPTGVVAPKATAWLRIPSQANRVAMYSFETPVNAPNCGVPNGLGRVLYSGLHSSNRAISGTFPAGCDTATPLSDEEKALAFQYFALAQCALGGAPPPPPPPPLTPTVQTLDYEGICPVGTAPEWQFLYWQSTTPPGSYVEFRAATADTVAGLPAAPPAAAPVTVSAGTATGAAVVAPNWMSDANTVAWHLANDPPGPSKKSQRWLRIYARLTPIGSVSPTITSLRQTYSCKPAE